MPRWRPERPAGRAVTLVEIIVALVILSLVMAGMANLFVSSRRWSGHAGSRLAGSGLAGHFLSLPGLAVSAESWETNCIGSNNGCDEQVYTLGGTDYTANYSVSLAVTNASLVSIDSIHKLELRISWNDASP